MKINGTDLSAFYEAWPLDDCWYHEGGEDELDPSDLDPDTKYDLDEVLGSLCYQGGGDAPPTIKIGGRQVKTSLDRFWSAAFKAWQASESTTRLVVEIPKDCAQRILDLVKMLGGKIR